MGSDTVSLKGFPINAGFFSGYNGTTTVVIMRFPIRDIVSYNSGLLQAFLQSCQDWFL